MKRPGRAGFLVTILLAGVTGCFGDNVCACTSARAATIASTGRSVVNWVAATTSVAWSARYVRSGAYDAAPPSASRVASAGGAPSSTPPVVRTPRGTMIA